MSSEPPNKPQQQQQQQHQHSQHQQDHSQQQQQQQQRKEEEEEGEVKSDDVLVQYIIMRKDLLKVTRCHRLVSNTQSHPPPLVADERVELWRTDWERLPW